MILKKSPPYNRTKISVSETQIAIQKLLLEYGAEGIQWIIVRDGLPQLAFIIEADIQGVKKKVGVRLETPVIREQSKAQETCFDRSMRLLFWYVKSKLEAVAYGVKSFEHEFLDDIVHRLPDGREMRVGDIISKQILEGKEVSLRLLGDGNG